MIWADGRLLSRADAAIPADDSAYSDGRGCYTSVRIAAGKPRFEARHLRRLARGAKALALGPFDPELARRALHALAAKALPGGEGAVRIQLSRDARGLRLVGIPRGLGADPPVWSAIRAPHAHEGALVAGGHKLTNRLVHVLAADAARAAGADEALLFDRDGYLVEASRSNVLLVDADERLVSPPLERGAVAGVALEVVAERLPLAWRDVRPAQLRAARALFAVNAVRGVRPIARLDGEAVGDPSHPFAARLAEALSRD
ncbi:MAG TPA: aminotransferase class IV [Myxococcota bacterium]|nr:aminotransferase class IV [Myxococcota bacterium]